MQMTDKFSIGDLIYVPSGTFLITDLYKENAAYGTISVTPRVATLIKKGKVCTINIYGTEYGIQQEDLNLLNFAEV